MAPHGNLTPLDATTLLRINGGKPSLGDTRTTTISSGSSTTILTYRYEEVTKTKRNGKSKTKTKWVQVDSVTVEH